MKTRLLLPILFCSTALAQLNQNCIVTVLNRTVNANPDGTWVLPNIPANLGQVKARATCTQNGVTTFGESDFFNVPANGAVNLPTITMGNTTPIPVSLQISTSTPSLTTAGQTTQLSVTATYPDGSTKDVSASTTGTNYTISNNAIATITPNGLITAVSSGTVVIQANNDGAAGIITEQVALGGTTYGGIPISWALLNNLNPNDPTMPYQDPDRDGLTNLQEYQHNTDPHNPDTDGDGLSDGDEVNVYHTNPLLADTDGDKIPDGVEVQTGTDPNNPLSYDLKKATATSIVTPPSFSLSVSVTSATPSVQLTWKVALIDGKTTLDLTNDPRTSFASNAPGVCGLVQQPGLIIAGATGNCLITLSQNTLSATVSGSVQAFTPTPLSFIAIPGFANNVKVSGSYAYVAAGSAGLQVVDVSNKTNPKIVAALPISSNANDLRITGTTLYLATNSGLVIIDITNPLQPTIVGTFNTPGVAWDVAISGNLAYIADGAYGLQIADVTNPAMPIIVGSLAIPNATAKGIAIANSLAVIAASSVGMVFVDISSAAQPKLVSMLATPGDARKVAVKGTAAFIADYPVSMQVVDFSIPTAPLIVAVTPDAMGGKLQDVVLHSTSGSDFTYGADVYFVNGVPIINVTQPSNPIPAAILHFDTYRDDNGHGIDVDNEYVYMTGEEGSVSDLGTSGDTRLYIGQYQQIVDPYGIPPTVSTTFPTTAAPVIQGQTITVTANATDDVAVASVTFLINGQVLYNTSSPPYQFQYTVPTSATTLTFGATATDYGNNTGVAQNVQVSVIPDPGTTVTGTVVDANGVPVTGATISVPSFQSSPTTTTSANGSFSLAGVSTISGNIQILATILNSSGATLAGFSVAAAPIRGGVTVAGTITVIPIPLITSMSAKSMLEATQLTLNVMGTTLQGATWSFLPAAATPIDIQVISTNQNGTAASLSITAPAGVIGTYGLVATNAAGNSGTTANRINRLTIVDPNSTADTDGDGFQDVIEAVFGTDPLDAASFPTIPRAPETESVVFSLLNAPSDGGATEAESVGFSVLNAPVSSAVTETESTAFSVLNAPVSESGIQELESVPFSVLNAPIGTAGITEADAYFTLCNGSGCPVANNATSANAKAANIASNALTQSAASSAIDPLADSDGDGLPDWFELLIGTDPNKQDTDGDGLTDLRELFIYHTDPLNSDTDGDGFTDGEEVIFGSDPLNSASTPLTVWTRVLAKNKTKKTFQTLGDINGKENSGKLKSRKAAMGAGIGSLSLRGSDR